jgi:hypothetical protein
MLVAKQLGGSCENTAKALACPLENTEAEEMETSQLLCEAVRGEALVLRWHAEQSPHAPRDSGRDGEAVSGKSWKMQGDTSRRWKQSAHGRTRDNGRR